MTFQDVNELSQSSHQNLLVMATGCLVSNQHYSFIALKCFSVVQKSSKASALLRKPLLVTHRKMNLWMLKLSAAELEKGAKKILQPNPIPPSHSKKEIQLMGKKL